MKNRTLIALLMILILTSRAAVPLYAAPSPVPPPTSTPPPPTINLTQEPLLIQTKPSTAVACPKGGTVRIATDATYAPFESISGAGQLEGLDIDLLNTLLIDLGDTPDYHNAIFDSAFDALSNGQYDILISAATITPERQKIVSFTNPYFQTGQLVVIRRTDQGTLVNLDSLKGKTGGAEQGTTSAATGQNIQGIKAFRTYPNADETLAHLGNKDIDFIITDGTEARASVANHPELGLAVIPNEYLTTEYYGIAVRHECTDLLDALNREITAYIQNGGYARLYSKYIGDTAPVQYLPGGHPPSLDDILSTPTPAPAAF